MNRKDLPEFELTVDDLSLDGITGVAIVRRPANQTAYVTFNEDERKRVVFQDNGEQRIATGVLLLPEQRIYRREGEFEYNVFFTAKHIRLAAKAMARRDAFSRVNIEHESAIDGVHLCEIWITGKEDKAAGLGFSVPEGTLMASYYIENDPMWQAMKEGAEFTGFSIEGLFMHRRIEAAMTENVFNEVLAVLDNPNLSEEDAMKELDAILSGGK